MRLCGYARCNAVRVFKAKSRLVVYKAKVLNREVKAVDREDARRLYGEVRLLNAVSALNVVFTVSVRILIS